MKLYQRFFILGSGLFTFFCFSLPWDNSDTGLELISFNNTEYIIVAFIASLMIIGLILLWSSRTLLLICSIGGIFVLLILIFAEMRSIEYGALLTAVGFFLTMAGVKFFPITEESAKVRDELKKKYGVNFSPDGEERTESNESSEDETGVKGDEE